MQCTGCGQPLSSKVAVCLHCGTPIPRNTRDKQGGKAILSIPAIPDPVLSSGDNWPALGAPTSPYGNYSTNMPPPPPLLDNQSISMAYAHNIPQSFWLRSRMWIFVLTAMLLVSLVGGFGASLAFAGNLRLPKLNVNGGGAISDHQHTTPTLICKIPPVDPVAAQHVGSVQLTIGLLDPDHKNYAPINDQRQFSIGQAVYVTFSLLTDESGVISPQWCLGTQGVSVAPYNLTVEKGNKGIGGYLSLKNLDATTIGPSVLIITWNNAIAAVIPFTVTN